MIRGLVNLLQDALRCSYEWLCLREDPRVEIAWVWLTTLCLDAIYFLQ